MFFYKYYRLLISKVHKASIRLTTLFPLMCNIVIHDYDLIVLFLLFTLSFWPTLSQTCFIFQRK